MNAAIADTVKAKKVPRRVRALAETKFWKSFLYKLVRLIMLIGLAFTILYPLLQKVSSSFMSAGYKNGVSTGALGANDLLDKTVMNIPRHPTFDNFITVINQTGYLSALINTALISLLCAALQSFITLMVGYGISKFKFFGRKALTAIIILLMIVPPQILLLPMYMQFRFFDIFGILQLLTGRPVNMIDTLGAPIILSLTGLGLKNGLYIFVMRQFFMGAPDELIEAAKIDGAGPFKTFFRVMAPLATPVITTVALLSFSWQWTDTFYSGLFFSRVKVLPNIFSSIVGIQHMIGADDYKTILLDAGALLVIVPLLVLYLFTQKMFVEGIERSGITG